MRVAICLSGYLRRYFELQSNWNKMVFEPILKSGHSYDIFISTYDELNSKSTFSSKEKTSDSEYVGFDTNSIILSLNPKSIVVKNFESIKKIFNIKNFLPNIDLSLLNLNIHDNGTMFGLSMHYQRYLANELKSEYEKKNGFKYDLVLMTRPDLFWLKPLDINIDSDKLYCRDIGYDYFLISSSENIDKITNLWNNIEAICVNHKELEYNGFPLYCPEYFLECYLDEIGFSQKNRKSIGEDSCLIYPRKDFFQTARFVLQKFNRLNDWDYVFN